jgi:hypothetical protein
VGPPRTVYQAAACLGHSLDAWSLRLGCQFAGRTNLLGQWCQVAMVNFVRVCLCMLQAGLCLAKRQLGTVLCRFLTCAAGSAPEVLVSLVQIWLQAGSALLCLLSQLLPSMLQSGWDQSMLRDVCQKECLPPHLHWQASIHHRSQSFLRPCDERKLAVKHKQRCMWADPRAFAPTSNPCLSRTSSTSTTTSLQGDLLITQLANTHCCHVHVYPRCGCITLAVRTHNHGKPKKSRQLPKPLL